MPNFTDSREPGRRRFLKVVGLAGLSSTLAAPLAFAQSSSSSAGSAPEKPAAPVPPPAELPEISAEARALAEVVRERYGTHLSAEQMEEIAKELTWRMRSGASLRQYRFANADEPDFSFEA